VITDKCGDIIMLVCAIWCVVVMTTIIKVKRQSFASTVEAAYDSATAAAAAVKDVQQNNVNSDTVIACTFIRNSVVLSDSSVWHNFTSLRFVKMN